MLSFLNGCFKEIPASAADVADVNSNNIKTLLANDKSNNIAFFIIGKATFVDCPRILPRNLSNCIVLHTCVFDSFILAYEL